VLSAESPANTTCTVPGALSFFTIAALCRSVGSWAVR
jgi:hypothetical protein